VIPSKLFEAMGMGLPILLAMPDGEAAQLVRRADAGLWVGAADPWALAWAVRDLAADPLRVARLAAASLVAAGSYSRDALAARMLAVLAAAARCRVVPGRPWER